MNLKDWTLKNMERVEMTPEGVGSLYDILVPWRDKFDQMYENSVNDDEPDQLYEDICAEICNVLNELARLQVRYTETEEEQC